MINEDDIVEFRDRLQEYRDGLFNSSIYYFRLTCVLMDSFPLDDNAIASSITGLYIELKFI